MLGHTHALSGAVAWLAAAPLLARLAPGMGTHGYAELGAAVVVTAGAALLPDLDHPRSTVGQALGPLTATLARWVAALTGGHRHGTHSVLFAVAAGYGGWALGQAGTRWTLPVVALLAALALAALGVTNTPSAGVLSCVAAGYVLTAGGATIAWLGPAVGIGCAAHLVGDGLTEHGIPLLWPLSKERFRLGAIDTGSAVERLLVGPALVVALAVLASHSAGWWTMADVTTLAGRWTT
jgi:membrane-bound metal-dependent hydrolase YbcI (DUF457 family)